MPRSDWAYVFPVAAFATVSVLYAQSEDTASAKALAWCLVGLATLTLVVVFGRMTYHHVGVLRGFERWGDPLVDKVLEDEKAAASAAEHDAAAATASEAEDGSGTSCAGCEVPSLLLQIELGGSDRQRAVPWAPE